mmetsp:Transcript_40973/g.88031  ORF Transcript_40973/g.88031 Transcript_40973/m.88031 type:complete len:124 (-) Transcript_40973:241-612(-)
MIGQSACSAIATYVHPPACLLGILFAGSTGTTLTSHNERQVSRRVANPRFSSTYLLQVAAAAAAAALFFAPSVVAASASSASPSSLLFFLFFCFCSPRKLLPLKLLLNLRGDRFFFVLSINRC